MSPSLSRASASLRAHPLSVPHTRPHTQTTPSPTLCVFPPAAVQRGLYRDSATVNGQCPLHTRHSARALLLHPPTWPTHQQLCLQQPHPSCAAFPHPLAVLWSLRLPALTHAHLALPSCSALLVRATPLSIHPSPLLTMSTPSSPEVSSDPPPDDERPEATPPSSSSPPSESGIDAAPAFDTLLPTTPKFFFHGQRRWALICSCHAPRSALTPSSAPLYSADPTWAPAAAEFRSEAAHDSPPFPLCRPAGRSR